MYIQCVLYGVGTTPLYDVVRARMLGVHIII